MKFATCLNCMDGRVQEPTINWIKQNYKAEFVDMITEPGISALIINEKYPLSNILKKIKISTEKHGSKTLFIAGHADCAGNPIDDNTHKSQVILSCQKLEGYFPTIKIFGLWIDSSWQVIKIFEK